MAHDSHGPLFSAVSSCLEKELLGQDIIIPDDEQTALARKAALDAPTVDNLLALAARLSFQQRHRESAEICRKVIKSAPDCYAAHRRLGLNAMKTLQHSEAWDQFFWCLERTDDPLDIHYRLGLSLFYQGQYEQAWYWFISCFNLSRDDGEMYIAVLYWSILCLLKMGRRDWEPYVRQVDPGHHIGYQLFADFAQGKISKKDIDYQLTILDPLSRTCVAYALYVWYEKADPALADRYMHEMLSCRDLWGSFSFLGGYTEYLRKSNNT